MFRVGGVGDFITELLSGPMLIVLATLPEPTSTHIIDEAATSNPNFGLVLSVA
jgi:hypothetical protein